MSDFLFDTRLERAARRYADEAIRPFDAVAIAEAAIRAAHRDEEARRFNWRLPNRSAAVAASAVAIAVIVGGSLLLANRGQIDTGKPSPSVLASPSPTPSATPPPVPVVTGQTATWLADQPANLSFGMPSGPARMVLTTSSADLTVAIDVTSGVSGVLRSSFDGFGTGEIRFTTVDPPPATEQVALDGRELAGCVAGDQGV
jgi:hypothetical protein